MSAETCASCGNVASEQTRTLRISRGDRSVDISGRYWSCPCPPIAEGAEPVITEWVDANQARAAEITAAAAWLEKYGEPMPVPRRPGRQSAEAQDERITLSLSASELAKLDAACGELSRNEFVRQAIQEKLARL